MVQIQHFHFSLVRVRVRVRSLARSAIGNRQRPPVQRHHRHTVAPGPYAVTRSRSARSGLAHDEPARSDANEWLASCGGAVSRSRQGRCWDGRTVHVQPACVGTATTISTTQAKHSRRHLLRFASAQLAQETNARGATDKLVRASERHERANAHSKKSKNKSSSKEKEQDDTKKKNKNKNKNKKTHKAKIPEQARFPSNTSHTIWGPLQAQAIPWSPCLW